MAKPPPEAPAATRAAFDAAAQHLRTVRDVLRFALTRFGEAGLAFGHGSDNALDEAAYLICHSLRLPLERLENFLDARLLPTEMAQVLDVLRRRTLERIPAAYITREAWLGEHRFYVDERVIVPRSYIAHWLMDDPSALLGDPGRFGTALELCTGSGCLAIVMAHALPDASITAVDISQDALDVAARNVAEHGLDRRITLRRGDLFGAVARNARFDLVVSNPPYVTAEAMQSLPAEYRHEPEIALAGGDDGLDLVRRILHEADRHLKPDGMLVMEVGHARDRVEAAFPAVPFTWLEIGEADDAVFVLAKGELPRRR